MNYKATMASARVFFSKRRRQHQRNGFINDEIPVVENGYDPQESDEDEVFVQDPNMELSASKPLMHPRTKSQRGGGGGGGGAGGGSGTKVHTRTLESCRLCTLCKPVFYFVALVTVLCAVMATIVYIANNKHGDSHNNNNNHNKNGDSLLQNGGSKLKIDSAAGESPKDPTVLIGCDKVSVEDVWVVGFPKILTESAIRLVDVNGDGVDDVIVGFATGADGHGVNPIVCDLYFGGQRPCLGGVIAVEGQTGKELWRRYTDHEVYGLNCQYDVNKDGVRDCLANGRAGTLVSVSGKDGSLLWSLGGHVSTKTAVNPVMNVYTPQYIPDVDKDGVPEIVVVHGGDPLQEAGSKDRLSGRILVLNGKTGDVIRWVGVPDGRESYYSPQILTEIDGSLVLLFGTGGETHNGSLWRVELNSLKKGHIDRAVKISSDSHKGFMTPPALVDVTEDRTPDLLIPSFNSTLLAIDGKNYQPLWSVHFPSSESYSTPAVGYYNDDDIPDVMVKYAHGPGFPVYYYSETTVIDGKTGAKLIDPPLRDTIGSQASPLAIGMEGSGNDLFMVWMSDCKGHEGATDEFTFTKGTSHTDKSKSDLCGLRFKSKEISRLLVVGRNLPKGGTPVYTSDTRKTAEHSQWVNTSAQAYEYVMKHPEIIEEYSTDAWRNQELPSTPDSEPALESEYYNPAYSNTHSSNSKKGPPSQTSSQRARTKGYNPGYSSNNRGSSRLSPSSSSSRNDNSYGNNNNNNNHNNNNNNNNNNHNNSPSRLKPSSPYYRQNSNSNNNVNMPEDNYEFPYGDSTGTYDPYGPYFNNDDNVYSGYNPYSRYSSSRQRTSSRRRGRRRGGNRWRRRRKKKRSVHEEEEEDVRLKMRKRRVLMERLRRHVGAHDDDGVQRLISTGTLAAPLLPPTHADYNTTMDVIFATYWSYPSPVNTILLAKDQKCISDKMAEEGVARFDADGPYYQMSHDQYEQTVTLECLESSRDQSFESQQQQQQRTYTSSDSDYNPFNINMGQMTLYRIRLKCTCTSLSANQTDSSTPTTTPTRCANILPFNKQKWSAYMGSNGDSYWSVPRT